MRRFRFETPQGELAALEFGNPADRLAALWLHGAGFNAMAYQSILAPLGLRTKIQAVDLRGHGRSSLPAVPGKLKSWKRHRDDVISFIDRESPTKPIVIGGHGMGGTVALMIAGARPDKIAGVVMVDPIIHMPSTYRNKHISPFPSRMPSMARKARKRRAVYGSQEEIIRDYSEQENYKTWRDPFLFDFLLDAFDRTDGGDIDSETQTWELLCSPKWEAANICAQRNRPWGALAKVKKRKIPISLLRPERGSILTDKVAARMLRKCPHLVLKERPNVTHFLPMQAPYDVRDQLSSYISSLIEGFSEEEAGLVKRSLRT